MITILMAAYNGENFISEQIESILLQTVTDWKLVIQDDCSTDATACIAEKFSRKYLGKIVYYEREQPSGSAKNNFSSMFPFVDSDYFMTSDDDDVWLPQKIEVTLRKMKEMERHLGKQTPILIHTDLKVVDKNLKTLSSSMFQRQGLDGSRNQFNHLLVQNNITGCTMMGNRALLDILQIIPEKAIMHDWWIALMASAFGNIGFIEESTILYRQHHNNEVGAKNSKSLYYNYKRLMNKQQSIVSIKNTYEQAKDLLDIHGKALDARKLEILNAYICIPTKGKMERLLTLQKYDFWKSGFYRRCGQILYT